MSLPEGFKTPAEYFEECVVFLKEFKFLFEIANIHILVNKTLDNIDVPDLEYWNMHSPEFRMELMISTSEFLQRFFNGVQRLGPEYSEVITTNCENEGLEAPVSPKKKHEVLALTMRINWCCEVFKCDTIVDIGSGLGYLDQHIYKTSGYKVIGFECNQGNRDRAVERQEKYHPDSLDNVAYSCHKVNEKSANFILGAINSAFDCHGPLCVTGLHACADLAVETIKVFLDMPIARLLILMPCCYHRMRMVGNRFENFPLSNSLKEIFTKHNVGDIFGIPFMRLATQPSELRQSLEVMQFHLMARAMLQLFAFQRGYVLKRTKRKPVKAQSCGDRFNDYIIQASEGYVISHMDPYKSPQNEKISEADLEELRGMWGACPHSEFRKASLFIKMQNSLQCVVENLILYDRLVYLTEKGVAISSCNKFFNEGQSPRCLALIAVKEA